MVKLLSLVPSCQTSTGYSFEIPLNITSTAGADCGYGFSDPDPEDPCGTPHIASWPLGNEGKETAGIIADGKCHIVKFKDQDGADAFSTGHNNVELYGFKKSHALGQYLEQKDPCAPELLQHTAGPCTQENLEPLGLQHFVYAYKATPA